MTEGKPQEKQMIEGLCIKKFAEHNPGKFVKQVRDTFKESMVKDIEKLKYQFKLREEEKLYEDYIVSLETAMTKAFNISENIISKVINLLDPLVGDGKAYDKNSLNEICSLLPPLMGWNFLVKEVLELFSQRSPKLLKLPPEEGDKKKKKAKGLKREGAEQEGDEKNMDEQTKNIRSAMKSIKENSEELIFNEIDEIRMLLTKALNERKEISKSTILEEIGVEVKVRNRMWTPIVGIPMKFDFSVTPVDHAPVNPVISCNWYKESSDSSTDSLHWIKVDSIENSYIPLEEDHGKHLRVDCFVVIDRKPHRAFVMVTDPIDREKVHPKGRIDNPCSVVGDYNRNVEVV